VSERGGGGKGEAVAPWGVTKWWRLVALSSVCSVTSKSVQATYLHTGGADSCVSPIHNQCVHACIGCSVFERFRAVLHEGEIEKRVQVGLCVCSSQLPLVQVALPALNHAAGMPTCCLSDGMQAQASFALLAAPVCAVRH
jgi:hypothetical protein